jgi:phosphopantothenoylcysteine decarboxylase/phosphopantothenate--cysteine ligase
MFSGKKILLGVSGGIAGYKASALVRTLRKEHAEVKVVMTKAATHFVSSLTFAVLSGHEVVVDLFNPEYSNTTIHIELARWADCVLICPATANIIAKISNGIADDALTTIVAATIAPIIFCPAMNKEMYSNPIYKANQQRLLELGSYFVDPGKGELACGEEGWGRLADESEILDCLKKILLGRNELSGLRILITAGRTEEAIDPIRFLTNAATGKMGFALAEIAALRGAHVSLISGPSGEYAPNGTEVHFVRSAEQMAEAVKQKINDIDVLIMF